MPPACEYAFIHTPVYIHYADYAGYAHYADYTGVSKSSGKDI